MKIPFVPRELVAHLDRVYPDRCPDPSHSDRQIWMNAGARSVVSALQQWLKEQDDAVGDAAEGSLPNVLVHPSPVGPAAAGSDARHASATAARSTGHPGNRLGGDA